MNNKNVDLRLYQDIIIDTINQIVPGKNPKVESSYFSTDELTQSEAISVGVQELGKIKKKKIDKDVYIIYNSTAPLSLDGNRKIGKEIICGTFYVIAMKPSSPEYKVFIQSFIDKIIVGRYMVDITIKTGLDVFPELDSTYSIKRQVIYEGRTKQYKERGMYI